MYFAIPVPFLNFILAAFVATFGNVYTSKYNDRSMDVWIKKHCDEPQPSQYFFHKDNIRAPDYSRGVIANDIQAATVLVQSKAPKNIDPNRASSCRINRHAEYECTYSFNKRHSSASIHDYY